MPHAVEEKKQQRLEKVLGLLRQRLADDLVEAAERFTRQYYAAVAPEDILRSDTEDLYGSVLAHWNFARHRASGTPLVQVYNPGYETHGWQTTHTVAEIVTDDMPFLVDSISMELVRHGVTVHLVIHPVIGVVRSGTGELRDVLPPGTEREGSYSEAVMRFEVDRQTDQTELSALCEDLLRVLDDVRAAVEDWPLMSGRMEEIIDHLQKRSPPVSAEETNEAIAFLRWVRNHHFTFTGFRAYDLLDEDGDDVLRTVPGSGLGILRDRSGTTALSHSFSVISPELRARAHAPELLILTKSTARSTVHRPAHLDYLGIKRFDEHNEVIGEWRFVGLYTSRAYTANPRSVPLLRNKVDRVLQRAGYPPNSHAGKAMAHILEGFPRDEMLQATEDELIRIGIGILQVQERHRLKLFVRRDLYERFISVLIYVPRDRYNTQLRVRIQEILLEAFDGRSSEFTVQFSELIFARVHFIIQTQPGAVLDYDLAELESKIAEAMASWQDELLTSLRGQVGEERGNSFFSLYGQAFPSAYREDFSVRTAALDIQRLDAIDPEQRIAMQLYQTLEGPEGLLRFKVYGHDQPMALSDVMPMLERMGLRVLAARPYQIDRRDGRALWILDFDMTAAQDLEVKVLAVKDIFQEAFLQVYHRQVESDGFNRLVLAAGLPWRDVAVLRAICKYLLQAGSTFSQAYMENSLFNNLHITGLLIELFHLRFEAQRQADPNADGDELVSRIETALDAVESLDEDRILRRFLATIQAILRTNYFQRDSRGNSKSYLSFKLDPTRVPELPLPLPMYEIYVYSARVEGVHLRGGLVARGGLRWSDRMEDFRTEVLGLMKAQMVKNAVIVPVGSKGGFVCKRLPSAGDREAVHQEVVTSYRTFISGLLDLTDNRVDGVIRAPRDVARYDGDDPYLVVAADKGTATFSDIANSLALEYGFWLGDAFASGGSIGYDHKKMGITARGAWESVKRHFRERGLNTQNEPFTVVGIGDMSGDVFGNGMLLSEQIRLVAAFNHMHVFIDPNPDPLTSYRERARMFALPRSSWEDYDRALISKGGGVYPRKAKAIMLSPEARQVLGIDATRLTPTEVIRAILRAPVDLLWNGGIGTYVKASSESHLEVGDKTNDGVRVDASELRCGVVGEGGNLGLTQLGRIQFARGGGLINTDAIDNSGGVDCSDHEVNIKILLDQGVRSGDMTTKQRNALFVEMTEAVSRLVLRDNYLQTQAISVTVAQASERLGDHARLMRALERDGRLNRRLEFLPSDREIAELESSGKGLTRPEVSVLLAYAKIKLYDQLLGSDIAEDPYLSSELQAYFPEPLQKTLSNLMETHPLRREIIATHITNGMVNSMGSTFSQRLQKATGEEAAHIARAYTAAREIFRADELWSAIESLDNQVPSQAQLDMIYQLRRLVDRATLWLLRNRRKPLDIAATIEQFAAGVRTISERLPDLLSEEVRDILLARASELTAVGVPEQLARSTAGTDGLYSALDIAEVASSHQLDIVEVGEAYFQLAIALDLPWLLDRIHELPRGDHWQQQAHSALRDELFSEIRKLTGQMLTVTRDVASTEARIGTWLDQKRICFEHYQSVFADLTAANKHDLAMLTVAVREVGNLSA